MRQQLRQQRRRVGNRPVQQLTLLGALLCFLVAALLASPAPARAAPNRVYGLTIDGVINQLTADHVVRVLDEAEREHGAVLLVTIDSPGGVDSAIRRITQAFLAARIPVVVYVGPEPQAEALSGAMFITLAGHVAAMAPDAVIGAALPAGLAERASPEEREERMANALQVAATTAEARGRNVQATVDAVRAEEILSADVAAADGIIDQVAPSVPLLLEQIDGLEVRTASGTVTLATREAPLRWMTLTLRERVAQVITNPNVAYLLFSTGVLLLIVAVYASAHLLAGIPAIVALATAIIAFGNLPTSWVGLGLLTAGALLFIVELYTPKVGLPGAAGVICYLIGSFTLYQPVRQESPFAPVVRVNPWLAVGTVSFFVVALLLILRFLFRARRTALASTAAALIGRTGVVVRPLDPVGTVLVADQEWAATSPDAPLSEGSPVRVTGSEDGLLRVMPLPPDVAQSDSREEAQPGRRAP